ncbi:MAG: hypothetical protein Q9M91_03700 [Candidatus Dojkabacteria bacterium]|nr:hypothetical protein [Candidatus Dojkabacteria bacterium]MDQ7020920.1 hypothetical protein [Candidatus Dojkabacteria bacterium]
MTEAQAKRFLKKIKKGYFFVSRYLDQEWGIWPVNGGSFTLSLNSGMEENKSESKALSEEEVIKMLTEYDYSYELFVKKLREYPNFVPEKFTKKNTKT